MIDERNIENIIGLIDSSNQKIKNIKETLQEQKTAFELPKNDFKNLTNVIDDAVKSKKFDHIDKVFENLNKNISFKTDFLKEQFKNLDTNLSKVQNIAKNIDKNIDDDINLFVAIVETFSYKVKIIQGIVSDISNKISSFSGESPEKFLRGLRSDCGDFDEEFDQLLRELKQNFKRASDITNKLSKLDAGIDIAKELFSINVSVNAIMSSLSIFDEKYKDLGKAFEESGLYSEFSSKIEDLSYNTKHLIRNIDNFNQVIENSASIKEQVGTLEEKINTINSLVETINQEGFLELKAMMSSIDNAEELTGIKNTLDSILQDNRLNEIKEKLDSFNYDEKLEGVKYSIIESINNSEIIQGLKGISENLENTKAFAQFEQVLSEIDNNNKLSQEKMDELQKVISVLNFSEVGKEISFLTNDLGIILEEIKHSRSISDKSFSKLENIFENFNLNEIKNRIFEFENGLKKFLQKDDLLDLTKDLQEITDRFNMANGAIIDGFEDLNILKNYILNFENKFSEMTENIQKVVDENQQKLDSTLQNLDNNHRFDEINNLSNDILSTIHSSKDSVLINLNEGQEKLELLIKAMDTSYKFDEIQDSIKNKLDEISTQNQNESAQKLEDIKELSQNLSEDVDYIKSSILDVIRENQQKFDSVLASLDEKVNSQDIQDKLAYLIQTLDNNQDNELDSKISDEINNGKYLIIDTIRESELKLEEFVKSVDSAHAIEDLKQITGNLYGEIERAKDSICTAAKENQDRFELMVKALDNSERIDEINDLSKTLYSELISSKDTLLSVLRNNQAKIEEAVKLTDVTIKVADIEDISNKIIEEIRFTKEIIQNVGRSINPDVLKDLQTSTDALKASIEEVHNSVLTVDVKLNNTADKTDISMLGDLVKERHEQLEYLIRAYDATGDISSIKEQLEQLRTPQEFDDLKQKIDSNKDVIYELRSILDDRTQNLELVIKSMESTDDISDLKNVLLNLDNEQKYIKDTVESIAQNASNPDDINYLKGILSDIESEQKDIKNTLEYLSKTSDLSAIQQSIENAVPYQQFDDLKQKIDSNKDVIYELRSILDERTQNLELVIKSMESTDDISDLKNVLLNLDNEQKYIKDTVESIAQNASNPDDINYLKGILSDIESEQKDIKNTLEYLSKTSDLSAIQQSIENAVPYQQFDDLKQKIDSNKDVIYELRSILDERTQNLELVIKSMESSDDLNALQNTLITIESDQRELKNIISEISHTKADNELIAYLNDIKNDISVFEQNILSIKDEISNVSATKDIQEAVEHLENIHYSIKESDNKRDNISAVISDIDNKISEIKTSTDINYDIKALLSTLQQDQLTIKALISSIEGPDDETINLIKNQIITTESAIRDFIEADSSKQEISQIKGQLDGLTQQILVQVMQIFDNISFDQETQEIKEYIDESHNSVKNTLNMFKTNIERLLDAPKPIYIDELKHEIDKIAQGLDEIGPEMSEYVNTITSLRVSLEELSKTKETVLLIDQNINNTAQYIEEISQILKQNAANIELLYTRNEAKEDFTKLKSILDDILSRQQEQNDNIQKENLKEGIDNVNLSINYINENLNTFLSEYRIFQDNLSSTTQNMEAMAATFAQTDSINSEYKKSVNETFKSLKKDFTSVISTVDSLYEDMNKVSSLTSQMVEISAKDKADILDDMRVIKDIIETSEINKLKDSFSTIIFSINGFLNSVDEKFASIIENTQEASDFTKENQEISQNIKASIINLIEWTDSASREFNHIENSVDSIKDLFSDITNEIRQISQIKDILADLDGAVASRVEEIIEGQLDSKIDAQILPEFELLEQKIDKKLAQKLANLSAAQEQDKQEVKTLFTEDSQSLKELINIIEQNIFSKIKSGVEQVLDKEFDLTPLFDKITGEFALANEKLEDGLNKIDSELYQSNVRIEDGFTSIANVVSNLNETLDSGLNDVDKAIKNISFDEVTSAVDKGLNAIGKKLDDTNLSQAITKIDDEFLAMNKKLDVDFFDLNKRVVDEFGIIEEKMDSKTDSMLKNIDESNKNLNKEIISVSSKINNVKDDINDIITTAKTEFVQNIDTTKTTLEGQNSSMLKTIEEIRDELLKDMSATVEKIANKLDTQTAAIENIGALKAAIAKMAKPDKKAVNTELNDAIKNIEQTKSSIEKLSEKIEAQNTSINAMGKFRKEIKEELDQIVDNIDDQTGMMLKNIEQSKEEMSFLKTNAEEQFSTIIQNISSIEKRVSSQENQIKSIDDKLELILSKLSKKG
ncbi:MAG: hypothetical protein PHE78_01425 [Candidatus Gastranaerophilales bacterium]|nr:hypothetical protein [Candidatus Gastranaerophilales bacterium]